MSSFRRPGAFDLLICDCDGVIIDSEIVCDRILMDMLREAYPGRDLAPALAGSFGLQTSDVLERLAGLAVCSRHVQHRERPDLARDERLSSEKEVPCDAEVWNDR